MEIQRAITTNIKGDEIISILHRGFSDASIIAYGAVIYVRVKTLSSVTTKLIMSNSRIVPLKGESIPRLELMAAALLSRLINSVANTMSSVCRIDYLFCWIDSQVVLCWIKRDNNCQEPISDERDFADQILDNRRQFGLLS